MKAARKLVAALPLLIAVGCLSTQAYANEQVEAPPPPPVMESGEALEPEVTIRDVDTDRVYEYRVNGKLVMVKVQPKVGPPYYFYDQNNDGGLDYSADHPSTQGNVNQWVLFRW